MLNTQSVFRCLRLLHTSTRSCNFIGPPDPVSNLRPVLYAKPSSSPPSRVRHPYSLREFTGMQQDNGLQWRIHRQQLDAFNHNFWTDVSRPLVNSENLALIIFVFSRITHDSKQRNKASCQVSQSPLHHLRVSVHLTNFIGNGFCRNRSGRGSTISNGASGILKQSCFLRGSNGRTYRPAS